VVPVAGGGCQANELFRFSQSRWPGRGYELLWLYWRSPVSTALAMVMKITAAQVVPDIGGHEVFW